MTNDANATEPGTSGEFQTLTASVWIQGFIILLGLSTNLLVIIVLAGSRFKIKLSTRALLIILAVTDFLVLVCDLLISFIPKIWSKAYFFYNESSCAFAQHMLVTLLTLSPWLLVLLTLERFIVIWFPIKGRQISSWRVMIGLSAGLLLVTLASYSFLYTWDAYSISVAKGYCYLSVKDAIVSVTVSVTYVQVWISLYFFIPAILICSLNASLVWKLCRESRQTALNCQGQSVHRGSKNSNYVKATAMVIVAAVSFVILMIPRGIVQVFFIRHHSGFPIPDENAWKVANDVTIRMQYLTHTTNFFIYLLANKGFRRALVPKRCHLRSTAHSSVRTAQTNRLLETQLTMTTNGDVSSLATPV